MILVVPSGSCYSGYSGFHYLLIFLDFFFIMAFLVCGDGNLKYAWFLLHVLIYCA